MLALRGSGGGGARGGPPLLQGSLGGHLAAGSGPNASLPNVVGPHMSMDGNSSITTIKKQAAIERTETDREGRILLFKRGDILYENGDRYVGK